MKLALKVTVDAKIEKLDIEEDGLKKLQTAVDGYIEAVDISHRLTMWVNEEGLLRNDLEVNPVAFAFYSSPILGDIVFTGGTDENGDTLGLDEETEKFVRKSVNTCRTLIFS